MRSLSPFLRLPALALGLATVHCGPPVATQPAPTPVYAEAITVPPAKILHESLDESEAPDAGSKDAPAPETQPSDEPRLEDAPVEPMPEPGHPEPDPTEPSGAERDLAAPAP